MYAMTQNIIVHIAAFMSIMSSSEYTFFTDFAPFSSLCLICLGFPLPQNQKEPLAGLWLSGICECRYYKHRHERRRHCDGHEHAVNRLVTPMYIFVHKQKTPFLFSLPAARRAK